MRKQHSPTLKAQLVLEMLQELRPVTQMAAEYGIAPRLLHRWRKEAVDHLPDLFADPAAAARGAARQAEQVEAVYAQIGRLTTQVAWLKNNLASTRTPAARRALVDRADPTLSVRAQAGLVGISRASLYYRPRPPHPATVAWYHRIDEIYTATPFYGSRRLAVVLRQEGYAVSRKRVQHAMRTMGIPGLAPGPATSRPHPAHAVYPDLLRGVTAAYPHHGWGIDITYIRLRGTWLYLVAILDGFSRYVVSWELSETLSLPFVQQAAERALAQATPVIWNHDQGSQFTSPHYTARLEAAGVQISMDGRGRAFDNIFTERLWRSVKYEEVYLNDYRTPREARQGLAGYLTFYNTVRPHQALGYATPAAVYTGEVTLE